jgi:O-antigen ligase
VSVVILVICAAGLTRAPRPAGIRQPLGYAILTFLGVSVSAILASPQRDDIAHLSISLLPATLLFFVIAEGFRSSHHTRTLYLTFSLVSLVLCSWLIWNSWLDGPVSPNVWMLHAGTPLLVVGNDVTFFAVVAPLSLVGLCSIRSIAPRAICAAALLSTIVVIVLFESRGAALTLIASLGCIALLIRPRAALTAATLVTAAIVTTDGALGFPLAAKFGDFWASGSAPGRIAMWRSAWRAFLESPWIGHGPHSISYLASQGDEAVRWAHNLYLDVLVGQGILGCGALLSIVAGALTLGWNTHIQDADDERRLLNAGALSALVGLLLAAIWEISFLRLWVVATFFAVVGVIAHLWALRQGVGRDERHSAN